MQKGTKIALLTAVCALVIVLALIVVVTRHGEQPDVPLAEEEGPAPEMYEGALAGLTEEEIGALAIEEEGKTVEDPGMSD